MKKAKNQQSNVDRFEDWMKNRVKSIYFANKVLMGNAYQKISEN